MRRREFITLVGGTAVAWPFGVRAQEPGRTYRIAGLTPSSRDGPHYAALFAELGRLGFIEGQNLTVEGRGFGGRTVEFPDIAMELSKGNVDVIFCAGDAAIRAAQRATTKIPILAVTDDMLGQVWCTRCLSPAATRRGSASSRPSLTARGKKF
jgi:putative tryptophan/tyrosine transport system substrate-binding protein